MSDTYEIEREDGFNTWSPVLETTGFVKAIATIIDERRAGNVVRVTIFGE